jgi:hypothetical protein
MSQSSVTSQHSHLEENERLQDIPFCLEDIPEFLTTDDPVDQDELICHLYHAHDPNQTFENSFETLPINRLKLTDLERRYKQKMASQAILSLRTRTQVVLDPHSIYRPDSNHIQLSCNNHYLDFFMAVSAKMGLGAVMPGVNVDHTWTLKLDLTQRYRQWRTNYGKLGFDSTGRMLYIGQKGEESVWFTFAPLAFMQNDTAGVSAGQQARTDSTLKMLRFRRFMMFLNYCLHKMAFEDLTVSTLFPDVTSVESANRHSNIL